MRYLVALCLLFLVGCSGIPLQVQRPVEPKKESRIRQREVVEPLIVGTVDGRSVVANRTEFEYEAGASVTEPRGSWWQRFKAGAFTWIIILILLSIFVPGFGTLMLSIIGRLRKGSGQMVKGIQTYLDSDAPEEAKKKLLDILSKTYDTDTKKLVSDIKTKV